jgi:hypothetical protein
MNNEWLNNLRSRMEDHEEDIPEGLWDDIRDELFAEEENSAPIVGLFSENQENTGAELKSGITKKSQRSLFYRMGGIAAAIALFILIMQLLPENNNTILSQHQPDHQKKKEKSSGQEIWEAPGNLNKEETGTLYSNSSLAQSNFQAERNHKAENIQSFKQDETVINDISEKTGNVSDSPEFANALSLSKKTAPESKMIPDIEKDKEEQTEDHLSKEQESNEWYAENGSKKIGASSPKKSWMLSMLTGSASSNSAEQQFPGYASIDGRAINTEQVWSAT